MLILFIVHNSSSAQYNVWVAGISWEALQRTFTYLAVRLSVQVIFHAVSLYALWSRGLCPLKLVRGVVVGSCSPWFFFYAQIGYLSWYTSLQLAHNGCDFSLSFQWLQGDSVWMFGNHWEPVKP
jgi:hypothetical protein